MAWKVNSQDCVQSIAPMIEKLTKRRGSSSSSSLFAVTAIKRLVHEHREWCIEVCPWRKLHQKSTVLRWPDKGTRDHPHNAHQCNTVRGQPLYLGSFISVYLPVERVWQNCSNKAALHYPRMYTHYSDISIEWVEPGLLYLCISLMLIKSEAIGICWISI